MMKLHPAEPADVGMSTARLDRIPALVQSWIDPGLHQAIVVLVARRGGVVLHEAFGSLTPEGPDATRDTIFPISSISKVITATAIMNPLLRHHHFDDPTKNYPFLHQLFASFVKFYQWHNNLLGSLLFLLFLNDLFLMQLYQYENLRLSQVLHFLEHHLHHQALYDHTLLIIFPMNRS